MSKKLLLLIPLLIFILAGCSDNELTTVTLMLDYTPNTNHTGIIAAKDLGYYEDEGINLKIIQPAEISVESAIATNQANFGISYQEDVLMANQEGMDITSIYGILNHNSSGIMSYSNKNINSPKDLEGKTYCGWGSDMEHALISSLMEADSADPSKLTFATTNTTFLTSNPDECDAFWEFESWAGVQAQNDNIDYNYIPFVDYQIDEYTPVIITSQSYIDENYDLVQHFINATIKGYQYSHNNPEEAAQIFIKAYPEYDLDFITDSQNYINDFYINDSNDKYGYQSDDIWNNFADYLIEQDIIQNKNNGDYTNEFVDNYYQSNS